MAALLALVSPVLFASAATLHQRGQFALARDKGVKALPSWSGFSSCRHGVLEKLNAALRLRRRSALEYVNAAAGGNGTAALGGARPLYEFAQAEFGGRPPGGAKIVALGGEPNAEIAVHLSRADLMDALDQLIEHEGEPLCAIDAVIRDTGQEPGSEALEHRLEHIIMRTQTQVDFLISPAVSCVLGAVAASHTATRRRARTRRPRACRPLAGRSR